MTEFVCAGCSVVFMARRSKKTGKTAYCSQPCHAKHQPRRAPIVEQACCRCKVVKPAADFSLTPRNRPRRLCRVCYATDRGLINAARTAARKYGITEERYLELIKQDCAICGAEPGTGKRRHAIDHDHVTGKVRSVLCHRCNPGLGYFRDDPELLEKAAAYLRNAVQDVEYAVQ